MQTEAATYIFILKSLLFGWGDGVHSQQVYRQHQVGWEALQRDLHRLDQGAKAIDKVQ